MSIVLYHHPFSRAANVVWMLEELGTPYELRFVDLDYEKVYFVDLAKGPSSMRVLHTESPIGYVSTLSGQITERLLHTDANCLFDI